MIEERTECTAEEFLGLPGEKEYELIDGRLRRRQGGGWSSWVGGRVFHELAEYAHQKRFGWAFPAGTSYQCFPNKPNQVLRPSASLVRSGRFPSETPPEGHIRLVPDLVVEVISPNDLLIEIHEKVEDYLRAGTPLVWVITPDLHVVQVHRGDGSGSRLRKGDELTGETVLPGFECPVAALFPPAPAGESAAMP